MDGPRIQGSTAIYGVTRTRHVPDGDMGCPRGDPEGSALRAELEALATDELISKGCKLLDLQRVFESSAHDPCCVLHRWKIGAQWSRHEARPHLFDQVVLALFRVVGPFRQRGTGSQRLEEVNAAEHRGKSRHLLRRVPRGVELDAKIEETVADLQLVVLRRLVERHLAATVRLEIQGVNGLPGAADQRGQNTSAELVAEDDLTVLAKEQGDLPPRVSPDA